MIGNERKMKEFVDSNGESASTGKIVVGHHGGYYLRKVYCKIRTIDSKGRLCLTGARSYEETQATKRDGWTIYLDEIEFKEFTILNDYNKWRYKK